MPAAQVSDKYVALARAVLDGEKALFASWAESATAAAPVLLREPVLCRSAAVGSQQALVVVDYPPALLEARCHACSGSSPSSAKHPGSYQQCSRTQDSRCESCALNKDGKSCVDAT